ncbi:D-amino-acid transaminase [Anaerosinus sp.]
MRPLGFFDGRIVELDEKIVAMEDRGHQFGDGIYEATRIYNGKCFQLKRHLDRCVHSLRELKIPIVYTYEELEEIHYSLIQASGITNGFIYFQITRGTAPREHGFPKNVIPHLSMFIRPMQTKTELQAVGVKCFLTPDQRWLRCDIKSLNLLGNVLAKQAAHDAKCFEAVMYREDKNLITEGSSSNFFIVKDEVIWTHPINNLILKGITRTILLEDIIPSLNLTILEKAFSPEFAQKADEAFITSTSLEVMPVISLGGKIIGDGKPGKITQKLQRAYREKAHQECK